MDELHLKKEKLLSSLTKFGSAAVAFSGGVDSTFLLTVAKEALGQNIIALTANISSFPKCEQTEAQEYCNSLGIKQLFVDINQLEIDGFQTNPPNRCYLCKRRIFSEFLKVTAQCGINSVIEGSNVDDTKDYRPGRKALAELGILSPLIDADLTKQEIRLLSKEMNLPTWNKPSTPCLATRFEYGELLTLDKIALVEQAEQLLHHLDFRQVRVRYHGKVARIEIDPTDFGRILSPDLRKKIHQALRDLGFSYVSLDLGGYIMGNMNTDIEAIKSY